MPRADPSPGGCRTRAFPAASLVALLWAGTSGRREGFSCVAARAARCLGASPHCLHPPIPALQVLYKKKEGVPEGLYM